MSSLQEKLEQTPPPSQGRARATLAQIYKMWGEPIITGRDLSGSPTEVTRKDLKGTLEVWERRGHGKDALFEKVEGWG